MSEFVEVRSPAQMEAVAELARAIWNQHYVAITGQAQVDYMLERFQSAEGIGGQIGEGYRYFLVADGDDAVGYVAVVAGAEESGMQLSKLYLLEEVRGRGLGWAMLEFAEGLCREQGLSRLWLTVNKHNAMSIAAYEHMGFRNTADLETDIGGGFVMDDYRLEKIVKPPAATT
jgi:diamine N-acetyltransferase